MTTFSQLINKMVAETRQKHLIPEITSYLNQTIRELHTDPVRNAVVFYPANMKEAQITATLDQGQTWTVPNPSKFQQLRAARYDSVYDDRGKPEWPPELKPGRIMKDICAYYYRVGNTYVFSGYGGAGGIVSLAYYEFPGVLRYYASGAEPATYDEIDGWTYRSDIGTDDASRLVAQNLVSNWLLLRWPMVVEEGVRAKVYKRLSDDGRARTSFSMFTQQRNGVYTGDSAELGG